MSVLYIAVFMIMRFSANQINLLTYQVTQPMATKILDEVILYSNSLHSSRILDVS